MEVMTRGSHSMPTPTHEAVLHGPWRLELEKDSVEFGQAEKRGAALLDHDSRLENKKFQLARRL